MKKCKPFYLFAVAISLLHNLLILQHLPVCHLLIHCTPCHLLNLFMKTENFVAYYLFGGRSVGWRARASNRKVAGSMPVPGITLLCPWERDLMLII